MEEKKKRTRKKKEAAEVMQELIREDAGKAQDTPLDICHVWQAGDNLDSVSKELSQKAAIPNSRNSMKKANGC